MVAQPTIAASASQYKVVVTAFSSNATVQKALAANPNRVSLMISDSAGGIFVGTDPSQLGTAQGEINLNANNPTLKFAFEFMGPWIQSAFFTCRPAGLSTTTFTEIIYSPSG